MMNTLDNLLAQAPPREDEKRFVDKSLQLAGLIGAAMQRQGLTQRALADRLGKKESEVSRWLSGLHNFTLKTLTRLEAVLGEDLVLTFRDQQLPAAADSERRYIDAHLVEWGESWAPASFQAVARHPGRPLNAPPQPYPAEYSLAAA